jgi:hypothetical protein
MVRVQELIIFKPLDHPDKLFEIITPAMTGHMHQGGCKKCLETGRLYAKNIIALYFINSMLVRHLLVAF